MLLASITELDYRQVRVDLTLFAKKYFLRYIGMNMVLVH